MRRKYFFNRVFCVFFGALLGLVSLNVSGDSAEALEKVIEDSTITAAVRAKLIDSVVPVSDIKLETKKGIVFMLGKVKSDTELETAVKLAFSVEGLKDVDTSGLCVQGSQSPVSDTLITAKIKGLYVREKLLGVTEIGLMGIHLETVDGVVFITGKVENEAQAEKAKSLATSVKGVKQVKADLTINKE